MWGRCVREQANWIRKIDMAPLAKMGLAKYTQDNMWKTRAILIVICPLVALMQDQVSRLQSLGINVVYITSDQTESVLKKIENGEYNLVFMSHESTLDNERWRSMIVSPLYSKSLMGIAVDEVHCVTQWSQSNSNRERMAFRKWYARLNELRSITEVPFMDLTATATTQTKQKISKNFQSSRDEKALRSYSQP